MSFPESMDIYIYLGMIHERYFQRLDFLRIGKIIDNNVITVTTMIIMAVRINKNHILVDSRTEHTRFPTCVPLRSNPRYHLF